MIGFPYDYGGKLTEKEAMENLKEIFDFCQKNPTIIRVVSFVFFTFLLPWFFNQEVFAADDKLIESLKTKSKSYSESSPAPAPTTIGIPRPQTNLQKAINTGAIGTSIGVLCLNAMWVPTPIGVALCLIAFTGYVVPPAWVVVLRGIRGN